MMIGNVRSQPKGAAKGSKEARGSSSTAVNNGSSHLTSWRGGHGRSLAAGQVIASPPDQ